MAAALLYPDYLPWSSDPRDSARLKKLMIAALLFTTLLGVVVPLVKLEKPRREVVEQLPERFAQVMMARREQPPPPPPPLRPEVKPELDTKKNLGTEATENIPEPAVKQEPVISDARIIAARKKAQSSGLLALSNELADLRDGAFDTQVLSTQQRTETAAPGPAQRSLITAKGAGGSGGIDVGRVGQGTGNATALAGRDTTQVSSKLSDQADINAGRKGRSPESVQTILDRNKGAIYAIYNRALREDPALQGKLVLELSISPAGKVVECRIISDEINAPDLVKKVIARVKMFDFGPMKGDLTVVTYPISFVPS